MAKVLGLLGSPRKMGNCDVLTQVCLEAASKAGAEVELVRLHDLNLKNCKGCLSCVYKRKCALDDDMPALVEKMVNASAMVIAAPTYIFSPSAVIKTLTDRSLMLTPYLEGLLGKERFAASISIAGNARWNPLGSALLKQCAMAYGFKIAGQMEAYGPGPAETVIQDDAVEKAVEMGKLLARLAQGQELPENPVMSGVECPVCKSNVFVLKKAGQAECAICQTAGVIAASSARFEVSFNEQEQNFFFIPDRIEHVNDWIVPSKERFFGMIKQIKARLEELGIKRS